LRKRSHISLAGYITDSTEIPSLCRHRKAFAIGSILPDCKPNFLTTKHEFNGTFGKVTVRMERLVEDDKGKYRRHGWTYYRDMGQVCHYLADYFTYPHNKTYSGGFFQHCAYEAKLKHSLTECIISGRAAYLEAPYVEIGSFEELIDYIYAKHDEYLRRNRCVEEDIPYIITLCKQVVISITELVRKQLISEQAVAMA